jgi:hypothetical protein
MHIHPLARLTAISRERLIRRRLDGGGPLKAFAGEAGTRFSMRRLRLRRSLTATGCAVPKSGWPGTEQVVWQPLRRLVRALKAPISAACREINALGLGRP